jgi:hypothetical protein
MNPLPKHELLLICAVILVLALAGYGPLLRGGSVPYSAHSDIVSMHLATKTVLYDSCHGGSGPPFWRNDEMAGVPAFTNPESQYTYPLYALFCFLRPENAAGPAIWLQFVAGALALYLVGKVLGLGRWACLFMAVAQLFNFKLIAIAYAGFLPILPIATLFPLLFAAVFRLTGQPGLKGTLALAAAGAACLNTGGFHLMYDAAIFLAGYLVWQGVVWWRSGQRQHLRSVALCVVGGGLLSAGVMAYLLVPLLAESPLLSRRSGSYEFFLSGYTLTARHLLNFLYPESFGRLFDATAIGRYLWEDVVYFGIVPLGLAFVGAIRGWRKRHAPFLVVAFALSLLLAAETPLTRTLYDLLPGFGLFRMPIRFVYLTGFFGIALAGIGLDETMNRLRVRRFPGRLASWARALPVALLVLVSAEGVVYARRYVTTKPEASVSPRPDYAGFFARDESVYRIAPLHRSTMPPGWAASLGLQMVTGYSPYNLDHYRQFFAMMQAGEVGRSGAFSWADLVHVARRDLLDILNVKYVVSPLPLEESQRAGFQQVAYLKSQPTFVFFEGMKRSDLYIYRNEHFVERAFWARQVVTVRDTPEMIDLMRTQDLRATAIVHDDSGPRKVSPLFENDPGDRVEILKASAGRLALETHSRRRRFLTISEIRHPGWQGLIDGDDLPLEACDLALMGAWIPAGDHRIELHFRPLYWTASVGISLASLVVGSALFVRSRWRGPG